MGSHEGLQQELTTHLSRLLNRIGELKVFLALVQSDDHDASEWVSSIRDARSLAVICTMAELESLVKTAIQRTHEELNAAGLEANELIPSVRQVFAHSAFESLRSLQDHSKLWDKRNFTTTLELCSEIVTFPVERSHPQPPLDGKTLKPEHFYRIWKIYDLPASPFPSPGWSGSLLKMAYMRNDIAHGNLPYHEIFSQAGRSVPEVEAYVRDIGDFAANFIEMWNQYLDTEGYLAS